MLEVLAGLSGGLVIAVVILLVAWHRADTALILARQWEAELLSRLASRDYEQYAAVKTFVEPWAEGAEQGTGDGSRVYDPTGLIEAESPPVVG